MSASPPGPSSPSSPPGGPKPGLPVDPTADPSMEDILASIRRILSEEEGQGGQDAPADDGVLQLDQTMMVPAVPPAPAARAPAEPAAAAPPPAPEPAVPPSAAPERANRPPPATHAAPPPPADGLVAPEAAAAAAQSVGSLVRTLSAERTTQVHAGGPTIEDIVRQEMRPLLKQWLDTYLPPLVERLVRAEIERVVGRAVL